MQTPNTNDMHKCFKKKTYKGFTLVELIVVITILVILGTIAFLNLQGFSGSARDSDRVTTIKNMENGLSIFRIKSGSYPAPESPTGTGVINTNIYSTVGIIGSNLSSIMKMNTLPTDPLSKSNYVYGIDSKGTQYQIALTLEDTLAYNQNTPSLIISPAYANTSYQAMVSGNYSGYMKYTSGATNEETWLANIPSLLFNNTGSNSLLSTGTYFLVNKQSNFPYRLSTADTIQNKNADEIIQSLTNSNIATLTGVNITNMITSEQVKTTFT